MSTAPWSRSCKSAAGGLSKGCEFQHFSEFTEAWEGSRQSWTCLCFSLLPQSPQSTLGQALPLSLFSFVGEMKVKLSLTLSLRWVIMFLFFSLFEKDFFFFNLRKAFVPLQKSKMVFRDEGGKKKVVPTALKAFLPWASQRQETKYSNSFCKKQMLNQSGEYKEQHEAYTITHFHTGSVLTSSHLKFAAKLSVQFPACFFNISESISVQLVGFL